MDADLRQGRIVQVCQLAEQSDRVAKVIESDTWGSLRSAEAASVARRAATSDVSPCPSCSRCNSARAAVRRWISVCTP